MLVHATPTARAMLHGCCLLYSKYDEESFYLEVRTTGVVRRSYSAVSTANKQNGKSVTNTCIGFILVSCFLLLWFYGLSGQCSKNFGKKYFLSRKRQNFLEFLKLILIVYNPIQISNVCYSSRYYYYNLQ